MLSDSELDAMFNMLHDKGAQEFGWSWYLMNRAFMHQCWKLGIANPDKATKLLLTMCARYALVNSPTPLPTQVQGLQEAHSVD